MENTNEFYKEIKLLIILLLSYIFIIINTSSIKKMTNEFMAD